ncbi:unnamed protein product [Adineta ricciae]|uniref:Uncharacterized protein n=1 Tax=Adineta ricciae TaxID=249248 RepID=A0A816GUL9_ADIRI|nr:unnamed protein product [Adineta ricciae]CAF1678502.1 unnamed protein product [Adineta ricciae]
MLPFTILIHNSNAVPLSSTDSIPLTSFLEEPFQKPQQSSFNQNARLLSLLSNIFLWIVFLSTVTVLQIGKHQLSTTVKLIYGLTMLVVILICYVFILFESKGCTEQLLLKKRLQVNIIKRELGLMQKQPKLLTYLTVTATNYYNIVRRKYIDHQLYDRSLWLRLQSSFYQESRLIETPFLTRQYYINIPDFLISENHLCQILFVFNLSIIGRDARIVHDDIKQEFQRLENKLFSPNNEHEIDSNQLNKLARVQQHIHFHFNDPKQHDLLVGQRRTCLTYENKTKIYYRWFLTENSFWIMTCIGLSWLFRAIFACLITQITVPIYIEIEGAMPLQSSIINYENNPKRSNKI